MPQPVADGREPSVCVIRPRDRLAGGVKDVRHQPAQVALPCGGEGCAINDCVRCLHSVHHVVSEGFPRDSVRGRKQISHRVVGKGFVFFVGFVVKNIPRHQPVERVVGVADAVARAVGAVASAAVLRDAAPHVSARDGGAQGQRRDGQCRHRREPRSHCLCVPHRHPSGFSCSKSKCVSCFAPDKRHHPYNYQFSGGSRISHNSSTELDSRSNSMVDTFIFSTLPDNITFSG